MALKVAVRPLKGTGFEVEVAPEATVLDLKKTIEATSAEFPADLQKLIYQGKILADDASVKDVGIKSGEFVVVMLAKANQAQAKPPPSSAASTPAAVPTPTPSDAAPAGAAAPMNMEAASATLVTGAAADQAVQQLMDMGFARPEVERCLQAAFGNPDRAVEYLMSGIPEGLLAARAPAPGGAPASPQPAAGGAAAPAPAAGNAFPAMTAATGGGGGGGASLQALEELRNNPRFAELAMMVSQNPQMLAQILPALAQSSPHLVQAIRENPEAFMRLLQESAGGGGGGEDPVAAMLAAAQGGAGGGGGGGGGGQHVVRLTQEEMDAVQRLVDLGFDRNTAAQAYLACDKNEELAANFLFENQMMDD